MVLPIKNLPNINYCDDGIGRENVDGTNLKSKANETPSTLHNKGSPQECCGAQGRKVCNLDEGEALRLDGAWEQLRGKQPPVRVSEE